MLFEGVMALDLGDNKSWDTCSNWDPDCNGVKGDAEEDVEEGLRLVLSRADELRTDEKEEVKGELEVFGLVDVPGLRWLVSSAGELTLVESGVSPRRPAEVPVGKPHTDCCVLAGRVFNVLGPEVFKF